MGTNYYTTVERLGPCPTCLHDGPRSERLHIGKSSMGWKFIFREHEDPRLWTAADWFAFLVGRKVIDEYGREHEVAKFEAFVRSKQTESRGDYCDRVDAEGYRFSDREFS